MRCTYVNDRMHGDPRCCWSLINEPIHKPARIESWRGVNSDAGVVRVRPIPARACHRAAYATDLGRCAGDRGSAADRLVDPVQRPDTEPAHLGRASERPDRSDRAAPRPGGEGAEPGQY